MNVSCLVIDDDISYCELIAEYVGKDKRLSLKGKYLQPEAALVHLEQEPVELVFLDISMPGMNGFDFIRSLKNPPYVILVSSHTDYGSESYNINALDYVLKPIDEARFNAAVDKALDKIGTMEKIARAEKINAIIKSATDYIIIRTDYQYVKIRHIDIQYIEAFSDFVKIYTSKKVHIALVTLKTIEEALPETLFLKIHRSYIINMDQVTSVNNTSVMIEEKEVPFSRAYADVVMQKIIGDHLIKR